MSHNVLGISGLPTAWSFRKRHWPNLTEREFRIVQGQDAAACLVVDGETVAAAAEERFNGLKHTSAFPVHAIRYCLAEAGLTLEQIQEVAHCFDYRPYRALHSATELSARRYREVYAPEVIEKQFALHFGEMPATIELKSIEHHLAHAASAYYTSGWDRCLTLVADGMGEADAISVWQGNDGKLRKTRSISAKNSIGIFYSILTLHLGFEFNYDEYKVMGLAPYGDPERFRGFFEDAVRLQPDGSIQIPLLSLNRNAEQRETYSESLKYIAEQLTEPRAPESAITQEHKDVAAALQQCLDRTMLHVCRHALRESGMKKLAMAGGVALNCATNRALREAGICEDIHVQPAAGDDGAGLGAALAAASRRTRLANRRMSVPYLGPKSSESHIASLLESRGDEFDYRKFDSLDELCRAGAQLIAQGHIIAWHRGRMEFGPRALGNRSILADPSRPDMKDRINALVKKREGFRPFAPAVTLDQAPKWFEIEEGLELPYMLFTAPVRSQFRHELPAITHVDGSARVQTVSSDSNPDFYQLLKAVESCTGRAMVLNTSFNVRGQPMVNSAEEALDTLRGTGMDALFLESYLVTIKKTS